MKLFRLHNQKENIISLLERGDKNAQRKFFVQHSPKMFGICRRYVKQLEDAEEVLSNAFIKIFRNVASYKEDGPIEAWMRKIVVNESLNFIRTKRNLFMEDVTQIEPQIKPLDENHDASALLRLIDKLPLGYRTVFNLYAIEGYAHKEIAQMLDISENTSRSQLHKARHFLQAQITNPNILRNEQS